MAAILPHLEVPEDVTPLERAYDVCVGSLQGSSLGEDSPACPSPDAVLADSHAGLLGMAFVRAAVEQSLIGKSFVAKAGDIKGKSTRNVYLVLDTPIGTGPAWNPNANPSIQQYELLSWTSKMNTPSWSLPAGAPETGGACPGAVGGQSVVGEERLIAAQKLVRKVTGKAVNLPQAVCQWCYATGGQYSTGQVQYAQLLRFLWARQAIDLPAIAPDGSASTVFVETMVYAIQNADYRLEGGRDLPAEPTGRRFFRIHDSGDFFSKKYLEQWKKVTQRLPDITFWAPSRIWATSWGVDAVNEINNPPANFTIRPSAYEVNEPSANDLGPGWASGSTVIAAVQNEGMTPEREIYVSSIENKSSPRGGTDPRYTWDCRAYATDDQKHTCRKAVAPQGLGGPDGKGCRACWIAPGEIINYTLH